MPTYFGARQAINRVTAKKIPKFAPVRSMGQAAHWLRDSTQRSELGVGNLLRRCPATDTNVCYFNQLSGVLPAESPQPPLATHVPFLY